MKRCYKEDEFVTRIEQALGVKMPPYNCSIVSGNEMTKEMQKAGWNKSQTRGVVGFHIDDKVFVKKGANWTTLHELIHRAGINADRINRNLAEGLTELVASELKTGKDEHKPTYPSERRWTEKLLKQLNMSALELGRIIAQSDNPPVAVANLLDQRGLTKNVRKTIDSLQPQKNVDISLNKGRGSASIENFVSPIPLFIGATMIAWTMASLRRG